LQPVGCGFDNDCIPAPNWNQVPPVQGLAMWNGELYACGEFQMANDQVLNFVARFDGTTWQPLAGGMDGPVRSVRAYPDGLYAAGWYTYADTVLANGLARWDGTRWHRVFDLPDITPLQGTNAINDMAIYEGTVYIGGQFRGEGDLQCLAKYDGTAWVPVGQGLRGTYASVLRMEVYDSLLYIAGAFADEGPYGHPLNPASGVVAWNGEDWVPLGTGTDGSSIPWVIDMAWKNDTLYVCGDFDRIGDVPSGRLGYWDGHRWCSLLPADPPWYVSGGTLALAFYNDTLHMGGYFTLIGTDTVNRVAQWIGGDHVEACGLPVTVEEPGAREPLRFRPYPVPTIGPLFVEPMPSPGSSGVVFDQQGRAVLELPAVHHTIDVSALAAGAYVLRLRTASGSVTPLRFLKQ
ncbi:MAG: T9SS type A sorting domain-containing protein, partial [Flavobacteriales bacterium]|nr:T9SS type A sorting domain-containing protein [Flavobacteriales bacterium]